MVGPSPKRRFQKKSFVWAPDTALPESVWPSTLDHSFTKSNIDPIQGLPDTWPMMVNHAVVVCEAPSSLWNVLVQLVNKEISIKALDIFINFPEHLAKESMEFLKKKTNRVWRPTIFPPRGIYHQGRRCILTDHPRTRGAGSLNFKVVEEAEAKKVRLDESGFLPENSIDQNQPTDDRSNNRGPSCPGTPAPTSPAIPEIALLAGRVARREAAIDKLANEKAAQEIHIQSLEAQLTEMKALLKEQLENEEEEEVEE